MDLLNIDWRALVILDAVLAEGNVSKAAKKLKISQPTVSQALNRLREDLKDPLFTRTRQGMLPTERAKKLRPTIQEAIKALERTVIGETPFSPLDDARTFSIASTDYAEFVLGSSLTRELQTKSPHSRLVLKALYETLPVQDLETGSTDIAVGYFPQVPSHLYQQQLFSEDFVAVLHKEAFKGSGSISLKEFTAHKHLLVAPWGESSGIADKILAKHGLKRTVVVSTPYFLTAPYIAVETNLLVILPRRLANSFSKLLPLKVLELPIQIPKLSFKQIWHGRTHNEPAQSWLRKEIQQIADR